MKMHRFYVDDLDLPHDFWLQDEAIYHQWVRVLRFKSGREVILFNGKQKEKLYTISKIGDNAIHLKLVTDIKGNKPRQNVYLCFSLLKKDKTDWVLQKATELGVNHFIPMISTRTEKTGFVLERAQKIIIEAAEQCGRVDIPKVREPVHLKKVISELENKAKLLVAEQGSQIGDIKSQLSPQMPIVVLIGPEGGWTDEEKQLFAEKNIQHVSLSQFTLRAETAALAAATHFA